MPAVDLLIAVHLNLRKTKANRFVLHANVHLDLGIRLSA